MPAASWKPSCGDSKMEKKGWGWDLTGVVLAATLFAAMAIVVALALARMIEGT